MRNTDSTRAPPVADSAVDSPSSARNGLAVLYRAKAERMAVPGATSFTAAHSAATSTSAPCSSTSSTSGSEGLPT